MMMIIIFVIGRIVMIVIMIGLFCYDLIFDIIMMTLSLNIIHVSLHVFLTCVFAALCHACSITLEAWFHSAHGMSTIAEFVGTRQGPNNAVKGWFGEEESAKDGTSMLEYLGC